jgi:hypothetical protein
LPGLPALGLRPRLLHPALGASRRPGMDLSTHLLLRGPLILLMMLKLWRTAVLGDLGRGLAAHLRLLMDRLRSNLGFVRLLVWPLITLLPGCWGEDPMVRIMGPRPRLRGARRSCRSGRGTKLSGRHAGGLGVGG